MENDNVKFKIYLISVVLVSCFLFLVSISVFADEVPQQDNFVYLFHLYYDNGQLFADRDFEFKYDVVPEGYSPEAFTAQFPFKGEIINFKNETAAQFLFDPKRGNTNFLKGKISIKAPYIADGQKAVFYNAQNQPLLTIFVSESSFCDDDGICNSDRGEDYLNCPNDCKSLPTTDNQQPTTSGENGQNGMIKITIYGLIVVGALAGGWYGWKWYKRRYQSTSAKFPPPPNPILP